MKPEALPASRFTYRSEGLRLACHTFGEPGLPPLLMVPGITMPGPGMAFVAAELCAENWVVVPDLRGRGDSDRAGPGRHRLSDYATDLHHLVGVLDLDIADTVVLGHSLGARIAAFATTTGLAPRGLILVDPPQSRPGRPYPTSWEAFRDQIGPSSRELSLADVRRLYPRWPAREQALRLQLAATCDPTAVLESWQGFHHDDFRDLWCGLDRPAVLVAGAESPVVLASDLGELRSLRPDIPVAVVPGAGHMVPWDNLEGFLSLVRPAISEFREGRP